MKVRRAEVLATAAGPEGYPPEDLPEVAVLGRSNVGKSSLLNRLVGRKKLAYTSSTPGKTRLLHFYRVERPHRDLVLVDLPGYGYAQVSRRERERWAPMIESYLEARRALRGCLLLQDLRRDPGDAELDLLAWLAERARPCVLVLTKADKLKPNARRARIAELGRAVDLPAGRIVATSAQSGAGIDALWKAIDALLDDAEGT